MWFTEDALAPGVLFGAAGVILMFSGWNSGRRNLALAGLLSLILGGSAFVVDALVITESERVESLVHSLCDDFRNKRTTTVEYFSQTAPELRAAVQAAMALVTIESGPRLTDFQIRLTNQQTRATSHFRANATISVRPHGHVGHQPSRFILTWAREPAGWKIIRVQRMHPHQDQELGLLDQSAG
jgi:hypothetical protein